MTSRLYRPISDIPDPSQMTDRRANQSNVASSSHAYNDRGAGEYYDAFETRIYPQETASPRPQSCLNQFIEVNEDDENSSDPMLSATIRNLYEDMAPTEAERSWNREYIDRAYPHNCNPINYRQQHQQSQQSQQSQQCQQRQQRQRRPGSIHNELPDYCSEPSGYRNDPPGYRNDHVYNDEPSGHHEDPLYQQGHVRLPSVHSTSGYGMYPESGPIGPVAAENLGRYSQTVECPWCHGLVTTRIKRRIGFKAGGAAVLVAAVAWPLFWVPLVVPGLHRKTHYCPQCRRKIGRGRRSYQ